jgi:drug/metabolite transporter (DMT)-like permease
MVTFLATVCSLIPTLLVLPWQVTRAPSAAALTWGVAAGLGGMAGALALYAGFRRAAFSVAGPLSAVSAAGLSVIAGVLLGERPHALSLAGIVVALPAIVLVSLTATPPGSTEPASDSTRSATPGPAAPTRPASRPADPASPTEPPSGRAATPSGPTAASPGPAGPASPASGPAAPASGPARGGAWAGVAYGLAAGTGFALLFVGLNRAGSRAGLWPVISGQAAEVLALAFVVALTGAYRTGLVSAFGNTVLATAGLAAITGITGSVGTILYFFATHHGFLAITAVLTSLYPAVTIGLARLFANERLSAARLAGLVLAGLSVTLIALGGTG